MVTAEAALVLPVLVLVLAAAVGALVVVGAQLRCIDAAREAVRAAARGEEHAAVVAVAAGAAPDGATVEVTASAEAVAVTVRARVAPLGLCFLPAFVCLGIVPVVIGLAGEVLG